MVNMTTTEKIWEELGAKLRNFILKRVTDEQVADDLLQETFIRIHKNLDGIDERQRLTSWVYQIARNLIIDHYRSKAREFDEIADEFEAAREESGNLNEVVIGWLPMMIAQLPDSYREAVELYEFKGLSQQQIADQFGISLSGAKSRIQRGRAKLKEIMLDCCAFEKDRRGNLIGYQQTGGCEGCVDDYEC